jgi:Icc-related predicted phosphoesterase
MTMRILILADLDDLQWRGGTGQADLVVALGDSADALILEAAAAHQCSTIFAVKGNHDAPAPFPTAITDLHLDIAEYGGLVFGGLNGSWRYKPRGHFLYEQAEVEALLAELPAVDVFISHNSPLGIHDQADRVHAGFSGLLNYVLRQQPRILLHGHQHQDVETRVGNTGVIGVYGDRLLELE